MGALIGRYTFIRGCSWAVGPVGGWAWSRALPGRNNKLVVYVCIYTFGHVYCRKEENVLFKDALNTFFNTVIRRWNEMFYLKTHSNTFLIQLYSVGHR